MSKLTKDQLKQIEDYVKTLPENEREQKMREIIAQFENPQCPFCLMVEGKIQAVKIYEDKDFLAVLEIKPASEGHVILIVKRHVSKVYNLSYEELEDLSKIIKKLSFALSKVYGSFNILISEGEVAGQKFDHLIVNIIPRSPDDSVNISWQSVQVDQKELEKIKRKIVENFPPIEKPKPAEVSKTNFDEELRKISRRTP